MSDESVFLTDESEELSLTQNVRKRLINKLTENDSVPAYGPDKVLLLGLLDGADRSVLSRAKLRSDKKRDEANVGAARSIMAELIKSINPRTHSKKDVLVNRELPAELSSREFVPGELHIGTEPITQKQVMGE